MPKNVKICSSLSWDNNLTHSWHNEQLVVSIVFTLIEWAHELCVHNNSIARSYAFILRPKVSLKFLHTINSSISEYFDRHGLVDQKGIDFLF